MSAAERIRAYIQARSEPARKYLGDCIHWINTTDGDATELRLSDLRELLASHAALHRRAQAAEGELARLRAEPSGGGSWGSPEWRIEAAERDRQMAAVKKAGTRPQYCTVPVTTIWNHAETQYAGEKSYSTSPCGRQMPCERHG